MPKITIDLDEPTLALLKCLSSGARESYKKIVQHGINLIDAPGWMDEASVTSRREENNRRRSRAIARLSSSFFACEQIEKRIVMCASYDLRRFGNINMRKVKLYLREWQSFYLTLDPLLRDALKFDDAHLRALDDPGFLLDYVSEFSRFQEVGTDNHRRRGLMQRISASQQRRKQEDDINDRAKAPP